jgi:hypothetical protein
MEHHPAAMQLTVVSAQLSLSVHFTQNPSGNLHRGSVNVHFKRFAKTPTTREGRSSPQFPDTCRTSGHNSSLFRLFSQADNWTPTLRPAISNGAEANGLRQTLSFGIETGRSVHFP